MVMIVQGDAQQDVEMAECVSGRVCAGVCGCVCEWVGKIDELREYVTKMNYCRISVKHASLAPLAD